MVAEKFRDVKDAVLSIGKALPILVGALGGIFTPSLHGDSPYNRLKSGDGNGALAMALANYTFYSYENEGSFDMRQGRGVKMLVAGLLVSKLIGWITD